MWKFIKDIFRSIIVNYICAIIFSIPGFALQAVSNKLKYMFGGNISMINYSNMYLAVRIISFAICAAFLLYAIKLTVKKEKNKPQAPLSSYAGAPQQFVFKNENNNQSGGKNEQNINFGKIPRQLTEDLKNTFKKLNIKTKFHIHVKLHDDESQNLGHEIKNFLIKNNFKYGSMTAHGMTGGNGEIIIQEEKNSDFSIIIGANETTNRPIEFTGTSVGID